MTKEKVTKPCPEEEKKKGNIVINADVKPEDEEEKTKAEVIPQWGLDLKASLERVVDLIERKQDPEEEKEPPKDEEEKKQDDEEKVPPKDEEEKQDDEEKEPPKDEEKQDDEEKPEDEEEKNKVLTDMVKTEVARVVGDIGAVELAKRGKAGDGKPKALDLFTMHKIPFSAIHKASGFPDVPEYDLTQVPGWKGQSSLLIRTRKKD